MPEFTDRTGHIEEELEFYSDSFEKIFVRDNGNIEVLSLIVSIDSPIN